MTQKFNAYKDSQEQQIRTLRGTTARPATSDALA